MGHHHVAKGAGLLVEARAVAETQRLRHVDLDMVDEVAVPDRLEQAVGEAEGQDVLRGSLPRKWSMRKICSSLKTSCKLGVERDRAVEIGAERLFHDDAAVARRDRLRPACAPPARRRRRHAQIVHAAALGGERLLRRVDGSLERVGAGRERHIVHFLRKGGPVLFVHLADKNWSSAWRARVRKPSASISSSETPMIRQPGMNPACRDETGRARACGATGRRSRRPGRRPADSADRPVKRFSPRCPPLGTQCSPAPQRRAVSVFSGT